MGIVEGIHDMSTYDVYVKRNSGILKPWLSEFSVLCRAYTRDMARFTVLHNAPPTPDVGPGQLSVDRMPVLMSCGKEVLKWLLSDTYIGNDGNAFTRHAASSHAQAYVFVGPHTPELVKGVGRDVAAGGPAFILIENWAGTKNLNVSLGGALRAHGATPLVQAEAPAHTSADVMQGPNTHSNEDAPQRGIAGPGCWTPELYVLEGVFAATVEVWRLPDWAVVEVLRADAKFAEAACNMACARIIAFG